MRTLLAIISERKPFGAPTLARLLMGLIILVCMTPPQFVEAKKDPAQSSHRKQLPTPFVEIIRPTETSPPPTSQPFQDADVKFIANSLVEPSESLTGEKLQAEKTSPLQSFVSDEKNEEKLFMSAGPTSCQPWGFCNKRPGLEINAVGEIDRSRVVSIQVQVGEQEKIFQGETVAIRLPLTHGRGSWINFWAITEDGARSSLHTIKYLSYKTGSDPEEYYFALIGDEWSKGRPSGSLVWEMFPPIGEEFPKLLEQPFTAGYLHTTNRYSYLAGRLIHTGKVDARECADGGIMSNGYATPCGDEKAADQVLEWQNKFDKEIFASAIQNDVPARILKGLIAQETQFWPASKSQYEIGLGSLTENGTEMLLAWNKNYFMGLCSVSYSPTACKGGYYFLSKDQQAALKYSAWQKALSKDEINVLGAVLYASAAQVSQMFKNTENRSPGDLASYEEMWKLAVANYHSGSGCIAAAMRDSHSNGEAFQWAALKNYLYGHCQQAAGYVDNVWKYASGQP